MDEYMIFARACCYQANHFLDSAILERNSAMRKRHCVSAYEELERASRIAASNPDSWLHSEIQGMIEGLQRRMEIITAFWGD